jgi:hypothetical protein
MLRWACLPPRRVCAARMPRKRQLSDLGELALRDLGRRQSGHQNWCSMVEDRYKAFEAVVEYGSRPDDWRSKLFPPFAQQIVEGVVANLVDDKTSYTIRPRPRMTTNQRELEQMSKGAKALEHLTSYQLDCARYAEKKRPLVLQSEITGLTAVQVYW